MRKTIAFLALVAVACGPSSQALRRSQHVEYQTEFARVWNVVSGQVHRVFPSMKIEDPVKGRILTDWKLVEKTEMGQSSGDQSDQSNRGAARGVYLRLDVTVAGKQGAAGPPWRVTIVAEAAEKDVNLVQLIPLRSADQPPWMEERVARLYHNIYAQLEGYALDIKDADVVVARPVVTPGLENLPAAAVTVVSEVRLAAARKDVDRLRLEMDASFSWSPGASGSVDTAIALWNADPSKLKSLAATLEQGCAAPSAGAFVCPAIDQGGPQAGFKEVGGKWRFVFFHGSR
jgi:hypothetical protein